MRKQSGFTLIELVIVVVILGFLAVTAIPKFINLTDQAKQANIEGMAGGFATAVSLARAQWEAEGRPKDGNARNSIDYDGSILILTTQGAGIRPGYVVSTLGGENSGATLGGDFGAANCVDIWQNIFQQPPRVTDSIATLNSDDTMDYFVAKSGNGASTSCHYYLKETLSKDGNGNISDPATNTAIGNSFTYQPSDSSVVVYINSQ